MRILSFTNLFPDSSRPNFGIFVHQRMAHFARRPGNSVIVVAPVPYALSRVPSQKSKKFHSVPLQERWDGIQVYHPRYPFLPVIGRPFHGLLMYLGARRLVAQLHQQHRFDCIDAHFVYPDGFAALLLAKMLKIPVVVSARGTDIHYYQNLTTIRPSLKWVLRNADGMIGVCQALTEAMVRLGAPAQRVRTIGNGVDTSRFYPVNRTKARQELRLEPAARIILAVGALRLLKGHHLLISAVAELKTRNIPVKLYIAGDGERRSALAKQIADLGITDFVKLLGNIPNQDLRSWYSAADISCLPSFREGWANVLLESMACGTPVVATRIWGTPEVVTSEDYGLLVEPNVQSLTEGLLAALQRPWDRPLIAEYASRRSWDVVAEEVENWLQACSFGSLKEPSAVTSKH